jgi:DegV family protein with EDD domain
MAGVRVVTDSSCDLPDNLVAEHGITIVPLSIRFGAEELVDRRDLTPAEFWARCQTSPVLPETAAPSPGAFEAAFRQAKDAGAEGVVCVNLSSKLSATIQAAAQAAKAVEADIPVRVIDSLSVSGGLGLHVLRAARMAGEGKGLDDVAGAVADVIPRTSIFATLDTLENLKKGGRIGGAQAFIGSLLSVKPVIEVRDGEVHAESKQRTRGRATAYLVDKVRNAGAIDDLAVIHGQAPDLDEFLDALSKVVDRERIVVGDIGAVIGTHAGPRAIGVAMIKGA